MTTTSAELTVPRAASIIRIVKHLTTRTQATIKRHFPPTSLTAIEQAISASELTHSGEIRLVAEAALDLAPLLKGQSARARALELFATLGIWDTEYNNGVLIYLLLADHAVEIVADRGVMQKISADRLEVICSAMELHFTQGHFDSGIIQGVSAIGELLAEYFPPVARRHNELPNAPVLM